MMWRKETGCLEMLLAYFDQHDEIFQSKTYKDGLLEILSYHEDLLIKKPEDQLTSTIDHPSILEEDVSSQDIKHEEDVCEVENSSKMQPVDVWQTRLHSAPQPQPPLSEVSDMPTLCSRPLAAELESQSSDISSHSALPRVTLADPFTAPGSNLRPILPRVIIGDVQNPDQLVVTPDTSTATTLGATLRPILPHVPQCENVIPQSKAACASAMASSICAASLPSLPSGDIFDTPSSSLVIKTETLDDEISNAEKMEYSEESLAMAEHEQLMTMENSQDPLTTVEKSRSAEGCTVFKSLTRPSATRVGPRTKKKSSYTMEFKLEICDRLRRGESQAFLARDLKVNESTIRTIKKREEAIREALRKEKFANFEMKSLKCSPYQKMEKALYHWILDQQKNHMFIDGGMVREKASQIQAMIEKEDGRPKRPFIASSGWLCRFKTRYDLHINSTVGRRPNPDLTFVNPN